MKAVVFHGLGDIRLDDVREPKIEKPTDALVRVTASAICGTDLHMIRGTMPGMVPGTLLGHEAVGIVEEVGSAVTEVKAGDRVVVPSTVCCGRCSYCLAGYTAQCDHANPNGPQAGTAFYGGPATTGPLNGLQAELARILLADANLVKLPEQVSDDQAILLSDIFPTGYFGADIAEIKAGDTVAVFGCGPVGLCTVISARLQGAGRIFAIDHLADRLDKAQELGAEPVNFDQVNPIAYLRDQTKGTGVLRAIDAVGVDAVRPEGGPAYALSAAQASKFREEQKEVAKQGSGASWFGSHWVPGDAPSQVLQWATEALAKAGTLSIIGVYPPTMTRFPIGSAMMKNLTVQMGNCNHRKYLPRLVEFVRSGRLEPTCILTEVEPFTDVLAAYEAFDQRRPGWIKVELRPILASA